MACELPFEAERTERIGWLISLRWLAVLAGGLALAAARIAAPGTVPFRALLYVLALVALYNAGLALYARTPPAGAARRLLGLQIVLDLLALAALIHFSGGIESPLLLLLLVPAALAGLLLPGRPALATAALAALLLAGGAALEYTALWPHHHLAVWSEPVLYRDGRYAAGLVGMMLATLALITYLTSSVSTRLRRRARALAQDQQSALARIHELEEANRQLRAIDAERAQFLSLATHELRAPINTIYTCTELALSGLASPDKVHEMLERVKVRAAEASLLTGDLLSLARAREEAMRAEPGPVVQPAELLVGVVEAMRAEAESKNLLLELDVDPALLPVRARPERLRQVWAHLLSNAISYTPPGGIVAVTVKQVDKQMIAGVRDTGIGVPADDRERIFEELYRAENARAVRGTGTGVGLALVRCIVENLGGQVWVESELGLGSKFSFSLPSVPQG